MKKRILLLTTGGTIASIQTGRGLAPGLSGTDLLSSLQDLREQCEIDTLEVCNLDSTNITWKHWIMLVEIIEKNYEKYDGFVIAHGTDTMAYTAGALSYLIQNSRKPIVLTGAQKPINMEITDAKTNLRDSILYTLDEGSHGVQVIFSGQVIAGTRAKKIRSFSYDAFSSINYPKLAVMQDERVIRYIPTPVEPGNTIFYKKVNPKVFLLKLTPGIQTDILADIFRAYDCIIVESFGVGGIPDSIVDEFFNLLQKYQPEEKILIMTTQVTYEGSNIGVYEVGKRIKERFRLLEAHDMTLEAVLTKIMWIMGIPDLSFEGIEALFYKEINHDTKISKR